MSHIIGGIARVHNAQALTGTGSDTSTSTWISTDTSAELALWHEIDSSGSSAVTIELLLSPYAASHMNGLASVTTDEYVASTIVTSTASKVVARYTPTEKAVLGYPPISMAVKITETAAVASTVNVWIERRG